MAVSRFTRWTISAWLTAIALCASFGSALAQEPMRVKFSTSAGAFVVEVYPDKAPKTVENFLQYVKDKHYDGTIFHRVIDNFMVQGGGFNAQYNQKPTRPPIPLEANNGLKNDVGTIAMARTSDPNSATSQFFINVKNNDSLNAPSPDGYGYTVFGKVVSGSEVIQKIKSSPTGAGGPFPTNVPKTSVLINSVTLEKKP
jgi:peptidyl-prolyl cis-trans isomerase A (cyclophilin A)